MKQVVEMLKTYLEKTGQDDEAELMKSFSERLTLNNNSTSNNNNSDMESSVKELLASLTALNLKKESDNWFARPLLLSSYSLKLTYVSFSKQYIFWHFTLHGCPHKNPRHFVQKLTVKLRR